MNLFSRNSIILYSLLGLVSLFLAGFIRNLLQFNTWLEVFITSCIIIPIPTDQSSGNLLRSVGYAESFPAESKYRFLDDGTFILETNYEQSIAQERIWFVSEHVRCRSSVLKTSEGSGILQSSFASEVRRIKV